MKKQRKAIALVSGGLDSLLAAKIIMLQNIHVEGLNFDIGFSKENPAIKSCQTLGIKLHVIDVIEKYRNVLLHPRHGYGAHLNPCLDCKIFMVNQALGWIKQNNFDFIVTGEVVGQRPKSQRKDTMPIVACESGAHNLLLRPLCAKSLPLTLTETEGWVDREKLYDMNGRSRKPQIELAKKLDITDYPQPAGGCLLTDKNFCNRLQDLLQTNKNYTREDIELLKIGRHLHPNPNSKIIIGRNEDENKILALYQSKYTTIHTISHGGPITLIMAGADVELAARITARFSSGRDAEKVKLEITKLDGTQQILNVTPMPPHEITPEGYITTAKREA